MYLLKKLLILPNMITQPIRRPRRRRQQQQQRETKHNFMKRNEASLWAWMVFYAYNGLQA